MESERKALHPDLDTVEDARAWLADLLEPAPEGQRQRPALTGRNRIAVETVLRRLEELEGR